VKSTVKRIWTIFVGAFLFTSTAVAQSTGTFTGTGNMVTARDAHTATLLLDGRVLIAGGDVAEGRPSVPIPTNSAELYDPSTGTFAATGNLVTARFGHTATLLPDGKVLIAGGFEARGLSLSAELYDPSTGTFTATGSMAAGHFCATLLNNGKVLMGLPAVGNNAELYDPSSGTFSLAGGYAGAPPFLSEDSVTLLPDGRALMVSGDTPVALYNPLSGTFTLTTTKWNYVEFTANLLMNGKVLFTGGQNYGNDFIYRNAWLYDASTGNFTATSSLTLARYLHAATVLPDGTVLITGGGFPVTQSAERYYPATETFSPISDMISGRAIHTSTLLQDGRVLIAGGVYKARDGAPQFLVGSAELYTPQILLPASITTDLRFDQTTVATGSSFTSTFSGSNLSVDTFFDVRFSAPGSDATDVVLNWQRGNVAAHDASAGIAPGVWTIRGVRAHRVETDHTGIFFPVQATITVSP
jgi:Galactose oxidase, central domain